ncbi:MAG: 4Fe-4S binding protein [Acidobacteria bacterium]|nr:4Fe-4S binding protein [Acidobacteriota bacterium]
MEKEEAKANQDALERRAKPKNKFGTSVKIDAQEYCIGCKMCELQCPDFAIFVNYEEAKKEGGK